MKKNNPNTPDHNKKDLRLDVFDAILIIGKEHLVTRDYKKVEINSYILGEIKANRCSAEFKKLYFSDKPSALKIVRQEAFSSGAVSLEEEQLKSFKVPKEEILTKKIAPIFDPLYSDIYFYSIELNKVVTMCEKHYIKTLALDKDMYKSGITCTNLVLDQSLPEGSLGDAINCHGHEPFIFW